MKDYYKIGEISEICDMSRDLLMHYEKLEILKPTRDDNGYRLYDVSDIWKLNLIKELKNLGFSFKMIEEYLGNRDLNSTNKILRDGINLLDDQILKLLKQKENMRKRAEAIEETLRHPNLNNIELVYLKNRKGKILNGEITRNEEFDLLIEKIQENNSNKFGILESYSIGAIFDINSLEDEKNTKYESVVSLLKDEEDYNIIFEEGYYVTLTYSGRYENNKQHIRQMFDFIEDNGLKIAGKPIEIYKIDINETENKEEFITEIQIPVKC